MKFTKNTILIIFLAVLILQLLIIGYNAYTGYIIVSGVSNFFVRLFIGTAFSGLFGLVFTYVNLIYINYLDKKLVWESSAGYRLVSEIVLVILTGSIAGICLTLTANSLMPYKEEFKGVLLTNTLIAVIVNILIVSALEAIIFFTRNQEAKTIAERLEKENALMRLDTLKNQLNPHFLFNSLNVLSALIKKDAAKAESFIEEFSSVYRYTLEVIDRQIVTLGEEISFADSYFYLQKIRFGDALFLEKSIDGGKLDYMLPSLSVQIILENAIKHNFISDSNPLIIKIYTEGALLVIQNNLQIKMNSNKSNGIGLKNLTNRYNYLTTQKPVFELTQDAYIAKLPLIQPEI
ncbi:MAG TPA: sensor histidine kinase [Ignavibacteriaceae bacterium]|nr:sensor histidine kinase [Ignavibacteriaceae bacterium]